MHIFTSYFPEFSNFGMAYNLLTGEEVPSSISLASSKNTAIPNYQYSTTTVSERNMEVEFGKKFQSTFQGSPSKMYNCHGLTFASRRTGIYNNNAIENFLKEEYVEIKDKNNVIIGDAIIYYHDNDIVHSAIIIDIFRDPISFRVLSKTRSHCEIVHMAHNSPYGVDIKYYRINHAPTTII